MLNARGTAPRATMRLPPLAPFSLILYAKLCRPLFLSLGLPLLLSSTMRAQIFMESSSSRARCIPLRSLVRSPACSRLDSFRFVSSRRGPGDQKRFNLRYRRWRAKPRFSSPDHGTEKDSTLARRVPIYTCQTVFSQHRREKEIQHYNRILSSAQCALVFALARVR